MPIMFLSSVHTHRLLPYLVTRELDSAVPFSSCSATTGSADRGRWREPASLEEEDGPCGVRLACVRPRDTSAMAPHTGKRRSAAHSSYSGHALSSET